MYNFVLYFDANQNSEMGTWLKLTKFEDVKKKQVRENKNKKEQKNEKTKTKQNTKKQQQQ